MDSLHKKYAGESVLWEKNTLFVAAANVALNSSLVTNRVQHNIVLFLKGGRQTFLLFILFNLFIRMIFQ